MNVTPVITTDTMIIATAIHEAAVEAGLDACTTAAIVTLVAVGQDDRWDVPREWQLFADEVGEALAELSTCWLPSTLAYLSTLFDND